MPCRKFVVLYEIGAIEKIAKLDRLRVKWIIYMNIEVTSNDEVMRGGGSDGKKNTRIY